MLVLILDLPSEPIITSTTPNTHILSPPEELEAN